MAEPVTKEAGSPKICASCGTSFGQQLGLAACPHDGGQLLDMQFETLVGSLIEDCYEVAAVLGSGGWGTVYAASHTVLGTKVAIKVMHRHLAADAECVRRFGREAQALNGQSHPNLCSLFSSGFLPSGQPYIVMEFLEGKTLSELIAQEGQLSVARCLNIMEQACDALAVAHSQGVIHRDLKPANILLLDDDRIKLLDFGLAKLAPTDQSALTATGQTVGTPSYMSPEQCLGSVVDCRSDIYALGLIMHESLTGKKAVDGATIFEAMQKHVHGEIPNLVEVRDDLLFPPGLIDVVRKCLATDAADRFARCEELRKALIECLDTRRPRLQIKAKRNPFQSKESSRKWVVISCALGLLTLSLSGVVGYWGYKKFTKPPKVVKHRNQTPPVVAVVEAETPAVPASKTSATVPKTHPGILRFDDYTDAEISETLDKIKDPSAIKNVIAVRSEISDDTVTKIVNRLPNVRSLNLGGTQVTDRGLVSLPQANLRALHLTNTLITDNGLKTLGTMIHLRSLSLGGTHITDQGLESLSGLRKLQYLDIAGTGVTPQVVPVLARLHSLTKVKLREKLLSDTETAVLTNRGIQVLTPADLIRERRRAAGRKH